MKKGNRLLSKKCSPAWMGSLPIRPRFLRGREGDLENLLLVQKTKGISWVRNYNEQKGTKLARQKQHIKKDAPLPCSFFISIPSQSWLTRCGPTVMVTF